MAVIHKKTAPPHKSFGWSVKHAGNDTPSAARMWGKVFLIGKACPEWQGV